ncbi:MAG: hypothetical protein HC821_05530, partial [Lewinella sp.]|nr:hypothetical protein [Lewinella sp.]
MGGAPLPVVGLPATHYYPQAFQDRRGQLLFTSLESAGPVHGVEHYYLLAAGQPPANYDGLLKAGSRVYAATGLDFTEKIYLGLYNGLGVVERRKPLLKTYLAIEQQEEFGQNRIGGIAQDKEGYIYLASESGQLYRLNPEAGLMDTVVLNLNQENQLPLRLQEIMQLAYDPAANALWGLGRRSGRRNHGILFRYDLGRCLTQTYEFSGGSLSSLVIDQNGTLYLGAFNGGSYGQLLRFDEATGYFRPQNDSKGRNFLNTAKPLYLAIGSGGKIYIGTEGEGLWVYHSTTQAVEEYSPGTAEAAGLAFNNYTIYAILPTADGILWLGTRGGLHRLDLAAR